MHKTQALAIVYSLRRWKAGKGHGVNHTRRGSWHPTGPFITNILFRHTSEGIARAIDRLMHDDDKWLRHETRLVKLDYNIWTFQRSLRFKSLTWHIKHLDAWQRGKGEKLPTLFYYQGKYVIWNGNHRMTAALILGRRHMKCKVFTVRGRR